MKRIAGERITLNNENTFLRLVSGAAEVYAVTQDKSSFRRVYLMELAAGECAFPAMDEFRKIDTLLYITEDAEIEEIPFDAMTAAELLPLMRRWFGGLISVPWLRLIADRGDEMLLLWKDGEVLSGAEDDKSALMEEFAEHEGIFAMLLGARFRSEDSRLRERLAVRSRQSARLMEESVAHLLDEEDETRAEYAGSGAKKKLGEAVFIVRRVAQALSLPTENISIAPELVQKIDQFGIMKRLVQKGNMQMRLVSLAAGWQEKDGGVMLGYYNPTGAEDGKRELAALIPASTASYTLVTMEHPEGVPVSEDVAKKIDRDAFACYAGLPAKELTLSGLLRSVVRQTWDSDWQTILLASVIAGLIPLVTPVITETVFRDIIPILDRQGLATVTQVSIVAGLTTVAMTVVRSIAILRFSTHFDMAAETAIWGRLLALPTQFFRDIQTGNLASRLMGMTAVRTVVSGELPGQILNSVFSLWSLVLMAYYSLKLAAVAVLLWLLYGLLMGWILGRNIEAERNMTTAKNATSGIVQQIFAGLSKFRVQGMEEQAYYLWSKAFGEEYKWNYKKRWQTNYMEILVAVQPMLLSLALYFFVFKYINMAGQAPTADMIDSAKFLAFHAAYAAFNTSLNAMFPAAQEVMALRPQLENLQLILDAVPEVSEDRVDAELLTGAVEIRNLTFSYTEGGKNVLDDVSLSIAAGEHVAIVGRSGCGKSTLLRLMLGFETPKSGAVYYDGQDLSGLSLVSVRSQMGVVLQNGQLMTGDIFTNIVGVTSLTQDDAWAAAEAAGIAEDIRQMPMGLQTMISEGSTNISGGQKQRILIARALAAHPAIIIFDEATSALDNRTQAIVTESLDRMKATRIVVAHR
ncbi:MAG: ATP-binding cassette domain-containing protein, partial [Schwartzia sp.]|nr:ATP-binding cassette domain-containing protein [Schwartzia sp. (in: firmicutes)]